jgi:homoserine O-acetyltransferase
MVEGEYRVMTEVLGLKHLHAVTGLSMGGEQTFEWSVLHPDFFDLAVPIIGTPRLTPYDLEVKEIMLGTISTDPAYANGNYSTEPDLKLANLFGSLTVTTPDFRNTHTTRENFRAFVEETETRQPIDANDRVWQLRAVVRHDVTGSRTIADVARSAHARFLVIVSGNDHLVNPQPALEWAAAIGAPTYVSQAECSHLIMTCDAEGVSSRVRPFLDRGKVFEWNPLRKTPPDAAQIASRPRPGQLKRAD